MAKSKKTQSQKKARDLADERKRTVKGLRDRVREIIKSGEKVNKDVLGADIDGAVSELVDRAYDFGYASGIEELGNTVLDAVKDLQ